MDNQELSELEKQENELYSSSSGSFDPSKKSICCDASVFDGEKGKPLLKTPQDVAKAIQSSLTALTPDKRFTYNGKITFSKYVHYDRTTILIEVEGQDQGDTICSILDKLAAAKDITATFHSPILNASRAPAMNRYSKNGGPVQYISIMFGKQLLPSAVLSAFKETMTTDNISLWDTAIDMHIIAVRNNSPKPPAQASSSAKVPNPDGSKPVDGLIIGYKIAGLIPQASIDVFRAACLTLSFTGRQCKIFVPSDFTHRDEAWGLTQQNWHVCIIGIFPDLVEQKIELLDKLLISKGPEGRAIGLAFVRGTEEFTEKNLVIVVCPSVNARDELVTEYNKYPDGNFKDILLPLKGNVKSHGRAYALYWSGDIDPAIFLSQSFNIIQILRSVFMNFKTTCGKDNACIRYAEEHTRYVGCRTIKGVSMAISQPQLLPPTEANRQAKASQAAVAVMTQALTGLQPRAQQQFAPIHPAAPMQMSHQPPRAPSPELALIMQMLATNAAKQSMQNDNIMERINDLAQKVAETDADLTALANDRGTLKRKSPDPAERDEMRHTDTTHEDFRDEFNRVPRLPNS